MGQKSTFNTFKYLTYLTSLGFSIIFPILICIIISLWIKNTFDVGNWIVILSIIIGIVSAIRNTYLFFNYSIKMARESEANHEKTRKP